MKNALCGAVALLAFVGFVATPKAFAQHDDGQYEYADDASYDYKANPYESANRAAEYAGESLASYENYDTYANSESSYPSYACDSGDCGSSCSGGGSGGGCLGGFLGRPGQFFVGADYLHVRSTFSEATAFIVSQGPGSGGIFGTPVTHTFQQLEYDYQSSYRVFGGYRLCDCGGEIRFSFTNFDSIPASAASPQASNGTVGDVIQIEIPGDPGIVTNGDQAFVNSNVSAKSYDLGFAKTIPLGSPAAGVCGCGDTCCDNGCGWCPAWDIKWSAGIRYAEVDWDRNSTNTATTDNGRTTMNFEGGGARVGLEGTRYFGRKQRFALFAKSDISLLLGTVDIEQVDRLGTTVTRTTRFSSNQIIPVLEIEAGGTVYVTNRLAVSSGYLFSAWQDLGMRDTFLVAGNPTFDDANILGFDGFFARAELAF